MITVAVPLGDRSYDVLVGHGARHELADCCRDCEARRDRDPGRDPDRRRSGLPSEVFTSVTARSKSLATIEELCRGFARYRV